MEWIKSSINLLTNNTVPAIVLSLLTLLGSSSYLNYKQYQDNSTLKAEVINLREVNKSLLDTTDMLTQDLQKKPKEIVKTVTEVSKELCEGEKKTSEIMHFKPSTFNRKEDTNEKEYVDIDAPFSDEFISLLK